MFRFNLKKLFVFSFPIILFGSFLFPGSIFLRKINNIIFNKFNYSKNSKPIYNNKSDFDNAHNYLLTLAKGFKKENNLVNKALSLPIDFNQINIEKIETIQEGKLDFDITYRTYEVTTNNGFQFYYLEVFNNYLDIDKNLLFLHGNTCSPDALLGFEKGRFSDPVAIELAKSGIRVIVPLKYDMYKNNFSSQVTINSALYGTTLESLEQIKIRVLTQKYSKDNRKISIYGFSHGAWQALIASQLNEYRTLFFHDLLVPPEKFIKSLSFYTDYDSSILELYDYGYLFEKANAENINILIGNSSKYYYPKEVKKITNNKKKYPKLKISIYEGGHFISSSLILKHISSLNW